MISNVAFATVVLLLSASTASANGSCDVPDELTREQKLRCLAVSGAMLEQPTLTLEQLQKGPGFDPADPAGSRHLYFTRDDTLTCYFRPYFAFIRDKGQSPKFLCWVLDPARGLIDRKGRKIDVRDVKVVVRKGHGGELSARSDPDDAHRLEADQVKINYLVPPYPNHSRRDNEVFTQVAATRLLWALGFPADSQYSALAVNCVGCSTDPFKDNLKENTAALTDRAVAFRVAAVERLFPGDALEVNDDDTWSWTDAAQLYAGSWNRDQKVAFDAYRLALGMLAYHNPLDSQNRLVCAEWKAGAAGPRICSRVVMMVQDVGSTFGKPGSFGNSRGDFSDWETERVFANADRCELQYPLKNAATVLEDARALLARRLETLDRERVRAIFYAARFDMMDLKQVNRLRHGGGSDSGQAAIDEWTNAFMQRAAEVRNARNCPR
jgi:hypothetical protein